MQDRQGVVDPGVSVDDARAGFHCAGLVRVGKEGTSDHSPGTLFVNTWEKISNPELHVTRVVLPSKAMPPY
jgi:hypothetical protein